MGDATEWRAWLKFQLQFKRHDDFKTMERTGECVWRVLNALRRSLHSPRDVEVADAAVRSHEKSGGSLRGGIYKALEALTQRYCPDGTRQKLHDAMDTLRKYHDTTVEAYTTEFNDLVDMYSLLPMSDGPTMTTAELTRLYNSGMPPAWLERAKDEHGPTLLSVGELETYYKRLEREEREVSTTRKRRYEDDGGGHHDDFRHKHPYERREVSDGCSYCREFCYGHGYKTHTDEKCYKNPKNKGATPPRWVPRGKCTAVFGPGPTPAVDESGQSTPKREATLSAGTEQPIPAPIVPDSDAVVKDRSPVDTKMHKTEDVGPSAPVATDATVKEEPTKCETERTSLPVVADAVKMDSVPEHEPVKSTDNFAVSSSVPQQATVQPFENVLLAMLGPFGQTDWCVLVLVDAATQIVELAPVIHATSEEITQAIDHEWLSRYPWPTKFIYSARVPAYDPAYSPLRGLHSALAGAEPAPEDMLSVLLLHLHLSIEMQVIRMHPKTQLDWANLVCVSRHSLRTGSVPTIAQATLPSVLNQTDHETLKGEDPVYKTLHTPSSTVKPDDQDGSSPIREFAPDDMVLVEYREVRSCVGQTPRREGPYRVEAVRTNGTLVIDKGKYLEHIHARRAVHAAV